MKIQTHYIFRKQALPTIFDYVPKYGIYEEQILSDKETTGLEDWYRVSVVSHKQEISLFFN